MRLVSPPFPIKTSGAKQISNRTLSAQILPDSDISLNLLEQSGHQQDHVVIFGHQEAQYGLSMSHLHSPLRFFFCYATSDLFLPFILRLCYFPLDILLLIM